MKTAIISDIHGNLKALEIVLNDISLRKIDRIVCLGDLVEGGDYDDEVVELIKKRNIITVQGNHDEYNCCNLKPPLQQWLDTLPSLIREENTIFTHISPRKKKDQLKMKLKPGMSFMNVHLTYVLLGIFIFLFYVVKNVNFLVNLQFIE